MSSFRLAIVCFIYEVMNFLVSRVLYIYTSEAWVYSKLLPYLKHIGYYVWDDIYMGVFLVDSMVVNFVLIFITAKLACRFINIRPLGVTKIFYLKPLHLILIWYVFAVVEFALVFVVIEYMSGLEFYKQLSINMNDSIREAFGDHNFVPLAFPLSLPIAVALVWFISAFLQNIYSDFNGGKVSPPNAE